MVFKIFQKCIYVYIHTECIYTCTYIACVSIYIYLYIYAQMRNASLSKCASDAIIHLPWIHGFAPCYLSDVIPLP